MKRNFIIVLFFPLVISAQQEKTWSLKQCIGYALQNHRSINIYENEKQIAWQKTRQAFSAYLPQIAVNSDFENNIKRQVSILPAGILGPEATEIAFGARYSSNFTIELKQPIYDKSLLIGMEAGLPNKRLAGLNAKQNMENLVYSVTRAYYQVMVSKTQLSLLVNNHSMYSRLLPIMQLQVDKGVMPKVEMERVRVNVNNMESDINSANYLINQSVNELKYYIGLDDNNTFFIRDTLLNKPMYDVDSVFNYRQQTGYQVGETAMILQALEARRIRADRLPKLNLYARYGTQALDNNLKKMYHSVSDYSYVGIRLSIPIFDGFNRSSQYNKARLAIANARENLKLNEEGMRLQYENSLSRMRQSAITLDNNKRNIELAKKVFAITTLQYEKGINPLSDLLNAEMSLREAENIYTKNLLNYYAAKLDLEKANGTLLQFYKSL